MKFAVMGNPIAHSLSPQIHRHFAQSLGIHLQYERIGVLANLKQQIDQFFAEEGKGLNITAPYKEEAFHLSQVRTPRCAQAQAANTLWMQDGILYADNTDGVGFCRSILPYLEITHARILIIGCGGATRGIIPSLIERQANVVVTNRTMEKAYELQKLYPIEVISMVDHTHSFDLVINATSNLDLALLPYQWFSNTALCHDLTYHISGRTPFTVWANEQNCFAKDGYDMLVEQAAEAFYIWHGVHPSVTGILGANRLR